MKKTNKIILGAIAPLAIMPATFAVACSSEETISINTGSYAGSMTKLVGGDITAAGSWGDSRFYAEGNASKLHVVGVNKVRISNDGIQAKPGMLANDQAIFQELFIGLIKEANGVKAKIKKGTEEADYNALPEQEKSLLIKIKGKYKTIFEIYSHAGYSKVDALSKMNYIHDGAVKQAPAMPDTIKPAASLADGANGDLLAITTAADWSTISTKSNKIVKIAFIPSGDAALVRQASTQLKSYLKGMNIESTVTTTSDYDTAAEQLESKQYDLAFLPVDTWVTGAPKSNFIIQAARPVQVNTINVSHTFAELPKDKLASETKAVELFNKYGALYVKDLKGHTASATPTETGALGEFLKAANVSNSDEAKILYLATHNINDNALMAGAYESWIYTKTGSEFDQTILAAATTDAWKLKWSEVKPLVKYGYTSVTSSASYIFPEIWFKDHFEGFEGF